MILRLRSEGKEKRGKRYRERGGKERKKRKISFISGFSFYGTRVNFETFNP